MSGNPRAALYLRISDDQSGDREGVARQREDCLALAQRHGLTVVEVYEDNDLGASAHSRKPRPAYTAMLAAARAGEVEAVVAYSHSRLTRRPRELEDWIDLAARGRVQVMTVVSGAHDLTTADGRASARTLAAWDAAEAERTSERRKRANRQKAAKGLPYGGGQYPTYGYTRDWQVVPAEAEVLREAFRRAASGESANSIARDFNKRGIPTHTGNVWSRQALARMLERPMYAGIVTDRGEILEGVQPQWEAIVDRDTWEAASGRVRAAKTPGNNARKYLLSGFLVCGKCHRPDMRGNVGTASRTLAKGRPAMPFYGCKCGGSVIKQEWTDAVVYEVATFKAAGAGNGADRVSDTGRDYEAETQAVDAELAEVEELRENGELTIKAYAAETKRLEQKRQQIVKDSAESAQAQRGLWWVEQRMSWQEMNLVQRRIFLARYVDSVEVLPAAGKGTLAKSARRLVITCTDGDVIRPVVMMTRRGGRDVYIMVSFDLPGGGRAGNLPLMTEREGKWVMLHHTGRYAEIRADALQAPS